MGYQVEALDGAMGSVDQASTGAADGYLVVGTGRWSLGRKVLIPAGQLTRADSRHRTVHVDLTKREIRRSPRYDGADPRADTAQN